MNPPSATAGSAADVWEVLDHLLDDVSQSARSGAVPEAFYFELLRRSTDALSALGGAAWEIQEGTFVRRAAYAASDAALDFAHHPLLDWAVRRGEPFDVAARATVDAQAKLVNPYDATLLLAPIVVDRQVVGVLELAHRPDTAPDARQGALRLLGALADSAADYHRERQRRLWQDRAANSEQFEQLVAALYADLDVPAVAYAAANEGRRWADCDRVSVVRCEGATAQTLAVSGVDLVDRRSDQVRLLERLVAAAVAEREPLWHLDHGAETESPAIGRALADYVDQSDVASLVVLPLPENEDRDERPPFAAIVLERFVPGGATDDAWRARVETLARHTARSLRRAVECDSVPLGRWWRRQYRNRGLLARRLLRVGAIAAAAILAAAVPFLIPAQATVEARGSLEPQERRDLFAPTDGVVAEVRVRHGQVVAADDPLIVLRKPELTVDLTRVAGELQTAERRLAALRASRTFENPVDAQARIQAQERTAEEEQLKETIRALGDEQKLLLEQVRDLTILAPFAGTVTTWDVERVLIGRPVARGQSLVDLAVPAGPWLVELLVPERLIGDVLAARRATAEPLAVEFVAATNPGKTYRGKIVRVAEGSETDSELGVVVRATVAADRETIDPAQLRPGAAVTARILCGASSLGAVWTRDLRHFLRSWWW